MSRRPTSFYFDLEVGMWAYALLGINPLWLRAEAVRHRELVLLVRRLRACGYDATDCIAEDAPEALRREVHAIARALKAVDPWGGAASTEITEGSP